MNIEQERAEFEMWHKREMWDGGYESGHDEFYPDAYRFNERRVYENMHTQIAWRGYQAGRAALPTQPKAEFEDPRVQKVYEIICGDNHPPAGEHWDGYVSRLIVDALQSQDRGDAERYRYLLAKLQQAYDGECFESDRFSAYCRMSSQYKGDRTIQAEITWRDKTDEPIGLSEAIDHARRIEGDEE